MEGETQVGRFEGVLLAADYDDTLMPFGQTQLSEGNRQAISYFMSEGGTITVSTGRDLHSFQGIRQGLLLNAPVILSNGAVIFSTETDEILYQDTLPVGFEADLKQILHHFPEVGIEVHRDFEIYVVRWNAGVQKHLDRMGGTGTPRTVEQLPKACTKIAVIAPQCYEETMLSRAVTAFFLKHWKGRYDVALSGGILDANAFGTNKGSGVDRLRQMLGMHAEHLYCVGDNWNDLPMLRVGAQGFVPASARPEVRNTPGVIQVRACREDALADVIAHLERRYPQ